MFTSKVVTGAYRNIVKLRSLVQCIGWHHVAYQQLCLYEICISKWNKHNSLCIICYWLINYVATRNIDIEGKGIIFNYVCLFLKPSLTRMFQYENMLMNIFLK